MSVKTSAQFAVIAFLALMAAWINTGAASPVGGAQPTLPFTGYKAPSAVLPNLENPSQMLDVGSTPRRGVILNFFASWCPPCQAEAPLIEHMAQEHPSNVRIVGVDMGLNDTRTAALAFVKKYGLTYPIARDVAGTAASRFQIISMPTTLAIGSDGRVVARILGPLTPFEANRLLHLVQQPRTHV